MLTFLKPRRKGWDDPFWCTFDAMLMHCWCIPSNTFAICWNTFNYLLPLNCSIASCPSILSSILLVVHYFSLWYPEVRVMMQWERRRRGRLTYSSELPPLSPEISRWELDRICGHQVSGTTPRSSSIFHPCAIIIVNPQKHWVVLFIFVSVYGLEQIVWSKWAPLDNCWSLLRHVTLPKPSQCLLLSIWQTLTI